MMLVNDERMKLFINAALMNCMDLNYLKRVVMMSAVTVL